MPVLNEQNIKADFLKITKLTQQEFNLMHIIDSAKRYVEKRIIPDYLSTSEQTACEYAACAHAVYEYTLQNQLSEKILLSNEGKAEYAHCDDGAVKAAFAFRKSVFDSVRDLVFDDNFVFRAMEG
ncbi:MAG: hypothetical protein IJU04_07095 [Ruminococcus sp.]|nr:hypothetical protein [Ruminococcus sp.]